MKAVAVILFMAVVYAYAIQNDDVLKQWTEFQETYGKSYRSSVETRKRLAIFKDNLNKIAQHNALYEQGKTKYTKAVNKFADWTKDEFMQYVNKGLANKRSVVGETFNSSRNFVAPASVDWRNKNIVTAVKDQEFCGACWAFSSTGAVEGQLGLHRKLVSLSEQNLVDCTDDDMGCDGGLITAAFEYIMKNGIESENDYPYLDEHRLYCDADSSKVVTKISSYVNIKAGNESDLKEAVATIGPISVTIDATEEMQFYEQGILDDPTCTEDNLNHAVLLVGYGSEDYEDYYLIKNSWGASWGEEGYVRLGYNFGVNPCGIADMASYPVL